jgi:biotin carboxyl carrier protein
MEKAAEDLKKIPILSEIKKEKAQLDYEEAKIRYEELRNDEENVIISESAAIARSEADLRVSQMEYERAQRNADRMLVKAPLGGMVVMMTTWRGGQTGQVQEGDQVGSGQPYMRIVDLNKMVVTASVNQVDAQAVRLGMRARVHFDAYPDVELPAKVTSVGAFAQSGGWRASYVRNVPIRLQLEGTDPLVVPDLSVSADLVLESADNATIVPREAVFGDEDQHYAFVHEADGSWEKRPVEVVMTSNTAVAVRGGVNPGDILAAEPPTQEAAPQAQNQ